MSVDVRLSRQDLAQARVIARGRGIRDVHRLVARYGGKPRRWVKKSSPPRVAGGKMIEVH